MAGGRNRTGSRRQSDLPATGLQQFQLGEKYPGRSRWRTARILASRDQHDAERAIAAGASSKRITIKGTNLEAAYSCFVVNACGTNRN